MAAIAQKARLCESRRLGEDVVAMVVPIERWESR
jgi:hypothetical protein